MSKVTSRELHAQWEQLVRRTTGIPNRTATRTRAASWQHTAGVIAVLLAMAAIGATSLAGGAGASHELRFSHVAEGDAAGAGESELGIDHAIHSFRRHCSRVWHEARWIVIPLGVVAVIKICLLRESFSDVVACWLSVIAFLLLHAIEVVRRAAIELRRLARGLRLKDQ